MRVEVVPDLAALATAAADIVAALVRAHPDAVLGLPTGETPIGLYHELGRRERADEARFDGVTAWALDEFCAPGSLAGTNAWFYRRRLALRLRRLRCPDGGAADPEAEVRSYAADLRRAGGLDLCLLGIGRNGHIAFNEPGSTHDAPARVVDLTVESREAHAANFGSLSAVPTRGMTLGVADILSSRRILLLATGHAKAAILAAALGGPETPAVPASWLQRHPDLDVIADAAAAALLDRGR
jgi:glucosamine-6-phosphate deaminase